MLYARAGPAGDSDPCAADSTHAALVSELDSRDHAQIDPPPPLWDPEFENPWPAQKRPYMMTQVCADHSTGECATRFASPLPFLQYMLLKLQSHVYPACQHGNTIAKRWLLACDLSKGCLAASDQYRLSSSSGFVVLAQRQRRWLPLLTRPWCLNTVELRAGRAAEAPALDITNPALQAVCPCPSAVYSCPPCHHPWSSVYSC